MTASPGFPIIIMILIPVRHFIVPRLFTQQELLILDAPTANSDAVLVSIGGPLPEVKQEEGEVEGVSSRESGVKDEEGLGGFRRRIPQGGQET